jgi:hypothetical protein
MISNKKESFAINNELNPGISETAEKAEEVRQNTIVIDLGPPSDDEEEMDLEYETSSTSGAEQKLTTEPETPPEESLPPTSTMEEGTTVEPERQASVEESPPSQSTLETLEQNRSAEVGIKPPTEERAAPQPSTIKQATKEYKIQFIDSVNSPEFAKIYERVKVNNSVVSENGQLAIKEGYVPEAKFYFGQDEYGEDVAIFQEKDREEAIQFTFEHQKELGIKDFSKLKFYSVADELWKEFQKALSVRMSQSSKMSEVKEERLSQKKGPEVASHELPKDRVVESRKNDQQRKTEQTPESDKAHQEAILQKEAKEGEDQLNAIKQNIEIERKKKKKKIEGQEQAQFEVKEDREKGEHDKNDIDKQEPPDLRTKR